MPDDVGVQPPRFGPRLVGSIVGHCGLLVVLFFWPSSAPPALPVLVTVDLVAAIPSARAVAPSRPAPKPKPVQKKIVLPKKAPALQPKPKAVKRPARVERPSRPKPEPALGYEDALDLLRMEQGEERPVVEDVEAQADAPTTAQGAPRPGAWQIAARRHVQTHWITPQEFLDRDLRTGVTITLAADGTVIGLPRVTSPSGDPFWDDNTVRAIQSASPMPAPPEPGEWSFVFTP